MNLVDAFKAAQSNYRPMSSLWIQRYCPKLAFEDVLVRENMIKWMSEQLAYNAHHSGLDLDGDPTVFFFEGWDTRTATQIIDPEAPDFQQAADIPVIILIVNGKKILEQASEDRF